jgi:hypothetical protein
MTANRSRPAGQPHLGACQPDAGPAPRPRLLRVRAAHGRLGGEPGRGGIPALDRARAEVGLPPAREPARPHGQGRPGTGLLQPQLRLRVRLGADQCLLCRAPARRRGGRAEPERPLCAAITLQSPCSKPPVAAGRRGYCRLSRRQRSIRHRCHRRIAYVARIFMRATLCRERYAADRMWAAEVTDVMWLPRPGRRRCRPRCRACPRRRP